MTRCWIALGGNLGEVSIAFRGALDDLNATPHSKVCAVSREFETAPVGMSAGPAYKNAAAEIETSLDPLPLLDLLQSIEHRWGRVREKVWGPRTLDLDLLLIEGKTVAEPRLRVPHPHMWYRRFVLDPLVEIAPDAWHPGTSMTIRELQARLLSRPFRCRLISDQLPASLPELQRKITDEFPEVQFVTSHEVLSFRMVQSGAGDPQVTNDGKFQIDLNLSGNPLETATHVLRAALGR